MLKAIIFNSYHDFLLALSREASHVPNESVIDELVLEKAKEKLIPFDKIEPDTVELLEQLTLRGFRLGVISNAGDMDMEPWPACRLAPFSEVFIASFQVGMLKPDPRIYQRGLKSLGVSADEAVFVGDGGSNELSGATRVGLRALWATWFLNRWSPGIRPGRFTGDDWRQSPKGGPPFTRLHVPLDLLGWVSDNA